MELRNSTLDDLAAVVGMTATLRLCAWFGDQGNLYVPVNAAEGNLLVNLIGTPAAQALSNEWPGEHIAVPSLRVYDDDLRRKRLAIMLRRGVKTKEAALIEDISERRVQQILRELEQAGLIPVLGPEENDPEKAG